MKKLKPHYAFLIWISLSLGLLMTVSCKKDEVPVPAASSVADFTFVIGNDAFAPCEVTFTNKSLNALSYSWDFGNGTTSTEVNPVAQFADPGVYTVRLTITPREVLHANKLEKTATLIIKDPLAGAKRTLFFTDRTTHNVRYFVLDGSPPLLQEFGHTALAKPYGIVIDTINDKIYVSDYTTSIIYRYNMDGFGLTTIASPTTHPMISGPIGMFIWVNKLYWCQEGGIYRCNLDGSGAEPWILTPTTAAPEMPIHMAFDPNNQFIYFTNDKYEFSGGVYRVKLDGTGMTLLVSGTDGGAIDLDLGSGKMYYADYEKGLCVANLDGSGEIVINTDLQNTFVWGMAINKVEGKIYWSNNKSKTIGRANLDGSEPEDFLTNVNPHAMTIDKYR